MISVADLNTLSKDRLEDAKALYNAGRYDGAFYICGYALELGLKKRICETLGWPGYPNTSKEFEDLKSFRIHNLEMLLRLSGVEGRIKGQLLTEWSVVNAWDPEIRYSTVAKSGPQVKLMLEATEVLLKKL